MPAGASGPWPEIARGRRLPERRRLDVDRTRDHLHGAVLVDEGAVPRDARTGRSRRIGESGNAVRSHAPRHLESLCHRVCGWDPEQRCCTRHQVAAGPLGGLRRRGLGIAADVVDARAGHGARVWEVRHAVGAHAPREREPLRVTRRGSLARLRRRSAGGDQEPADEDDCDACRHLPYPTSQRITGT